MRLSDRAQRANTSPTLALDARTKELQAKGEDIISFAVGEPDFDTPEHVKEAATQAIAGGFTKYTPTNGIPELRKAIVDKLCRENGLSYQPGEVIVSVGAKHSLYNAVMALCDPADEVLIPSPYWVSYPEMVKLAGATPVMVPPDKGLKVTPGQIAGRLTARSKGIILNSPANPTGAVYSRQELEQLAELIVEHDLWVISDEIYEHLVYDGNEHVSMASLGPEIKERTVVVNGVSKAFAMTGWRIGYAAGPVGVIQAMGKVQIHATSNPTSISQHAAVAALTGPMDTVWSMREEFDRRRRYMTQRLQELDGFSCQLPQGAFYVFCNISPLLGRCYRGQPITSDEELAELILTQAHLAVVPGSGFGVGDHLRFSYATSLSRIEEGLEWLASWLEELE